LTTDNIEADLKSPIVIGSFASVDAEVFKAVAFPEGFYLFFREKMNGSEP
jgi:hypothetical protein